MSNGLKTDLIIGEVAALENLIAHCESDIGEFRRNDLTDRQNAAMWDVLERLKSDVIKRRAALLAKL